MRTLKGYCEYCGYFHGVEESSFVVDSDVNYEMGDGEFAGTGKKRVIGKCTKCGGIEFFVVGGEKKGLTRRAGRGAARGVWGLTKGLAKATGMAAVGTYKAAKWGYDKTTKERPQPADDPHAALPDPPPEGWSYGDAPDSEPPPLPADIIDGWTEPHEPGNDLPAGPPELPDGVFASPGDSSGEPEGISDQIADRPEPDGFHPPQEDPYGDRPEEHRIDWSHKVDTSDPYNEIDDAPLEDDDASGPLPHEGPVERRDRDPHPDYTKPPTREKIQAYDDRWRRENYGKVSREEWESHDAEYRRLLRERKRLDLREAGGRIDHGDGSYEELLPDGTIHTSEVKTHGAGSRSHYESWERPDGTSTATSAADESSMTAGRSGTETQETSVTSRVEFDGDGTHHVHAESETRTARRRAEDGPPELPPELDSIDRREEGHDGN